MSETRIITAQQIQLGIAGELNDLPKLINESVKDVDIINIDSKEKLPIANSRLGTLNELLKHIEKMRKEVKTPYLQAGKDIENYANSLKIPLENAKKKLSAKILGFKKEEEAKITIEQNEKKRQEEEKKKRKEWEINLLDRIRIQVNARLFGGQYITGNGTIVPCSPAQNVQQVTEIYLKLSQEFPMSQFNFMKKEAEKAFKELSDTILNHQKKIATLIKEGKLEETIAKDRNKAEAERLAGKAQAELNVEKEEENINRKFDKELKESTKGIRKTIEWTVTNIADVPIRFLTIDPAKVSEFISENKQLVKNSIDEEKASPIPGIRFYEHSTFVAK